MSTGMGEFTPWELASAINSEPFLYPGSHFLEEGGEGPLVDGVGTLGLWQVEIGPWGIGLEGRLVGGEAGADRHLKSKTCLEWLIPSIHPSIPSTFYSLHPKASGRQRCKSQTLLPTSSLPAEVVATAGSRPRVQSLLGRGDRDQGAACCGVAGRCVRAALGNLHFLKPTPVALRPRCCFTCW